VARKKRKKHRWLWRMLTFLLTPLVVWCAAFIVWLFWHDIVRLLAPAKESVPARAAAPRERASGSANPGRENIANEDRKSLEDLLHRR
jgi:hypothetical protein